MRTHRADVVFILGAVGMILTLAWDWSNVKSFITGGVIAGWLAYRTAK